MPETCLRRATYASAGPPSLPTYVMHYPPLSHRRSALEAALAASATRADVTWVLCANRDAVGRLSAAARACLVQPAGFPRLANGTLSLSLKHLGAYRDIRRRRLRLALLLEDDVALPHDLWPRLSRWVSALPADADILWLGGGSRGADFHAHPNCSRACGGLRRRDFRHSPRFVGSAAYVMTARAAEAFRGWPVRAPPDFQISLKESLCWGAFSPGVPEAEQVAPHKVVHNRKCHLLNQYGPPHWFLFQSHADPAKSYLEDGERKTRNAAGHAEAAGRHEAAARLEARLAAKRQRGGAR